MDQILDHRQIADEMEIFVLDAEVGAGLPLWLPNGSAIREALERYMKELEQKGGYQRVHSPHIAKAALYQRSGHLAKFGNEMFPPIELPSGEEKMYLRPMNCPHHHKIFAAKMRSYRDLPIRLAEYGQVYRFENSGALRGLSRVRSLCQNDAHIYVQPEKAFEEILKVLNLHEQVYRDLGLVDHHYRLSLHDPSQFHLYQGQKSDWRVAEDFLKKALQHLNLKFVEVAGEAAFYGPKIDVQMEMAGDREESVASLQLDICSAENFQLSYRDGAGNDVRPWVIHRAPLGSHERFVALLLEKFQGRLPLWLAPVQLAILPMPGAREEDNKRHAEHLADQARAVGARVSLDLSSGSLNKRMRFVRRFRPGFIVVVGEKECDSSEIVVRGRDSEKIISLKDWKCFFRESLAGPVQS